MKSLIAKKMEQFHALSKFSPRNVSFCLRLLWLGAVSIRYEKQVNIYSINEPLSATNRNMLHAL